MGFSHFVSLGDGADVDAGDLLEYPVGDPEFAVVVRSDLKGQGLGHALLEKLIRYVRRRGTPEVVGQVLAENRRMLALARSLGFAVKRIPGDEAVEVRLRLAPEAPPRGRRRARR